MSLSNSNIAAAATPPSCGNQKIKATKPYGTAEMHKLLFHVYDAQFWSEGKGWNAKTPYALHLKYFVSIDAEDFVDRSLEELSHNPKVDSAMMKEFKQILPPLLPAVKEGDSITALHTPNKGLFFCHNGKSTGMINNEKMEEAFMGIWLGKHTSEPEMRKKLLRL